MHDGPPDSLFEHCPTRSTTPIVAPVAVLAIDPSLSGCAVALAVDREPPSLRTIKTATAKLVHDRVARYRKIVEPIVDLANAHPVELCLIEGYSFGSAGGKVSGRAHDRAELGGVLRDRLDLAGVRIAEVAPTTLKKFATGKGNAGKAQVVSEVSRRYGRTFTSDDEADAYALLMLGLCLVGRTAPETKAQREAVAKVREGMEVHG